MNGYEPVRLTRDNGPDLAFDGKCIAFVSSDPAELGNRWTELSLYRTEAGKFISQSVGRSKLPGEGDISNCKVFVELEDAADFFTVKNRVTWLSREMYVQIQIEYPQFDRTERVG